MKGELADEHSVGMVVAGVRGDTAHDVRSDDAVFVARPEDSLIVNPDESAHIGVPAFEQPAASEQDAAKPFRRVRGIRRQRVLERLGYRTGGVDRCFPCVSQYDIGVLVERVDTTFEQMLTVEVVRSSPLEELAA